MSTTCVSECKNKKLLTSLILGKNGGKRFSGLAFSGRVLRFDTKLVFAAFVQARNDVRMNRCFYSRAFSKFV